MLVALVDSKKTDLNFLINMVIIIFLQVMLTMVEVPNKNILEKKE